MIDFGKKIWVIDGAMGTMLQSLNLREEEYHHNIFANHKYNLKGCFDSLNVSQPEIISRIHNSYLLAGADIISTNTFNANAVSLSAHNLQEYDEAINIAATDLAKVTAREYMRTNPDREIYVAGVIGPTHIPLSSERYIYDSTTHEAIFNAYYRQATSLIKGNADILLIETAYDIINIKYAIEASLKAESDHLKSSPLILSVTPTKSGTLQSGEVLETLINTLSDYPLAALTLNCVHDIESICCQINLLSDAPWAIGLYPCAGLPDSNGVYSHTPEFMTAYLSELMKSSRINIVGGCCGTTPAHISHIAVEAAKHKPRKIVHK